jgi:hypothetical protein
MLMRRRLPVNSIHLAVGISAENQLFDMGVVGVLGISKNLLTDAVPPIKTYNLDIGCGFFSDTCEHSATNG